MESGQLQQSLQSPQLPIQPQQSLQSPSINLDDDTMKLQSTTNAANTANTANHKPRLKKIHIEPKCAIDMIYLLSHIIIATILVLCLKKINPILLFVLLTTMLGYISYEERDNMPIYLLVTFGLVMYFIDLLIMRDKFQDQPNKSTTPMTSIINILYNTIWKIPYYGILIYYIILFLAFLLL